jgi:hypothetical protein
MAMKRHELAKWAIVAAALLLGAAGKSGSIYYKSQKAADAALAQFDTDNPKCQLWTNWQKMCSRTGEAGATWCTTDPDRPVKPSVPFCVVEPQKSIKNASGFGWTTEPKIWPVDHKLSVMRFCRKGSVVNDGGFSCMFEENRPFNGRRLAARRHPWCQAWYNYANDELICSEGSNVAGVADCASLLRKKTYTKHGMYCGELIKKPSLCSRIEGGGRSAVIEAENGERIMTTLWNLDTSSLHGLYCEK